MTRAKLSSWLIAGLIAWLPSQVLAQASLGPSGSQDERAHQLRLEISDLRMQQDEISQTGPVLMMIFGYVFAPLILVGPAMLAIGDVGCDSDGFDCTDLTTAGWVLTGLGAVGAGVGIAGLVLAIDNSEERERLGARIKDRQRELETLGLHFQLGPQRAALALRARF